MNILSGDMMSTGELLDQLKSNVRFRVTSARDMVMGIRGESSMSPIQRRRELRDNRLSLLGMDSDEDVSSSETVEASEPVSSGSIGVHTTKRKQDSVRSSSHGVPSMDEVDEGTKSRADESGFSQIN